MLALNATAPKEDATLCQYKIFQLKNPEILELIASAEKWMLKYYSKSTESHNCNNSVFSYCKKSRI